MVDSSLQFPASHALTHWCSCPAHCSLDGCVRAWLLEPTRRHKLQRHHSLERLLLTGGLRAGRVTPAHAVSPDQLPCACLVGGRPPAASRPAAPHNDAARPGASLRSAQRPPTDARQATKLHRNHRTPDTRRFCNSTSPVILRRRSVALFPMCDTSCYPGDRQLLASSILLPALSAGTLPEERSQNCQHLRAAPEKTASTQGDRP